jgi:ParB/RepB/Spo0J family partition protein
MYERYKYGFVYPVDREMSTQKLTERKIEWIEISKIVDGGYSKRELGDIKALAASIEAADGVQVPLIVAKPYDKPDSEIMETMCGNRRLAAAKSLGHTHVPCDVRPHTTTPAQRRKLSAIENLQRKDLTILERAKTIENLKQDYEGDLAELAEALGYPKTTLEEWLDMAHIDPAILGTLKPSDQHHAHLLAVLPMEKQQETWDYIKPPMAYSRSGRIVDAVLKYRNKPVKEIVEAIKSEVKDIVINVKVWAALDDAIRAASSNENISKSRFITNVLEDFLEERGLYHGR